MWSVCSFHNTEVSKMSETEEFVSGTVSCAICGVPITERNIGYHRERLCNHVKDVPEVKLELFQILKLVYKEYAWLKRPRSPDDKRLRAKVLHIENHFLRDNGWGGTSNRCHFLMDLINNGTLYT